VQKPAEGWRSDLTMDVMELAIKKVLDESDDGIILEENDE
jgi:hypothetical protein